MKNADRKGNLLLLNEHVYLGCFSCLNYRTRQYLNIIFLGKNYFIAFKMPVFFEFQKGELFFRV